MSGGQLGTGVSVSHWSETELDEAWTTYKSAVEERDLILKALDRKRSAVLDRIETVEAAIRALPNWHDSGDQYASLANERDRLWLLVSVIDSMASAAIKATQGPTNQLCRALERSKKH